MKIGITPVQPQPIIPVGQLQKVQSQFMTHAHLVGVFLMAEAMVLTQDLFAADSGRRAKMQFYAECIRDCFDTTLWPETTLWEQVLE